MRTRPRNTPLRRTVHDAMSDDIFYMTLDVMAAWLTKQRDYCRSEAQESREDGDDLGAGARQCESEAFNEALCFLQTGTGPCDVGTEISAQRGAHSGEVILTAADGWSRSVVEGA